MIDSTLNESIFWIWIQFHSYLGRFGKPSTLGALPLIDLDTNKVFCNQIRLSGISPLAQLSQPSLQAPPVAGGDEAAVRKNRQLKLLHNEQHNETGELKYFTFLHLIGS